MTSRYEYFFKFVSKARYRHFWSPRSKCLATPLLCLSVKHVWNHYHR